jgi:hypothetical protein
MTRKRDAVSSGKQTTGLNSENDDLKAYRREFKSRCGEFYDFYVHNE